MDKGEKDSEIYRGSPISSSLRVRLLFVEEYISSMGFHYDENIYKCIITTIPLIAK